MHTVTVQGRTCAFGIDVSNNNGRRPIDADQVAAAGFVFVCAKATEGRTFRDAYYPENRDRTKAAGMLFGAYHWLKPSAPLDAQVANFLTHTSNGAGCDFVACDAEEAGLTDELVVGWCEQVHDATGLPVWLYCGAYTDPKVRSDRWLKFTPWLAAYPVDADNDDDPTDLSAPRVPGPWGRWDVWQYDSDGAVPGVAGNCDLNVIDVRLLDTLNTPTPPVPLEDDMAGTWHRWLHKGQGAQYAVLEQGGALVDVVWLHPDYVPLYTSGAMGPFDGSDDMEENDPRIDALLLAKRTGQLPATVDAAAVARAVVAAIPPSVQLDAGEVAKAVSDELGKRIAG